MIYILYLQPTETQLEFFLRQEGITYFNPKTESSSIGIKNAFAFARKSIDAYKEKYPFEILFIRKYNVDDAVHPEKIYITADEKTIDFLVNSPMIRKILKKDNKPFKLKRS